jgi:hypothetical protein
MTVQEFSFWCECVVAAKHAETTTSKTSEKRAADTVKALAERDTLLPLERGFWMRCAVAALHSPCNAAESAARALAEYRKRDKELALDRVRTAARVP